jgi:hypothetical protein
VSFKGHIFQRTLILSYACLSGSTTKAIHLKHFPGLDKFLDP